jgi:hypothetical protein
MCGGMHPTSCAARGQDCNKPPDAHQTFNRQGSVDLPEYWSSHLMYLVPPHAIPAETGR